jgi:hypothetical protein
MGSRELITHCAADQSSLELLINNLRPAQTEELRAGRGWKSHRFVGAIVGAFSGNGAPHSAQVAGTVAMAQSIKGALLYAYRKNPVAVADF